MHCVLTYLFYPLSNPDSPRFVVAKVTAFSRFSNSFNSFYSFYGRYIINNVFLYEVYRWDSYRQRRTVILSVAKYL